MHRQRGSRPTVCSFGVPVSAGITAWCVWEAILLLGEIMA